MSETREHPERGGAANHPGAAVKNGWQKMKLDDVCQFINGLWKGESPPFVNIGVFRNTNFTKDGTLDDSNIAYLDVEARKFEKRRLTYGDVILEKSGGGPKQPVGRVALFDKKDGEFSFSNFTAAMRVNDPKTLDFRFLHKFLFWMHLSGVTEMMQSHSTGIRNLNGDAYKNIEIPLPPLPEQRRIVSILDEAFDGIAIAKANAEKNLQNARALFESHLQAVFTERGEGSMEKPLFDLCSAFMDSAHRTPDYQDEGIPALRPRDVVNGNLDISGAARVSEEEYEIQSKRYKPRPGDIVYSRELSYGWAALVPESPKVCLSQGMCVFRPIPTLNTKYLLYVLNGPIGRAQAICAAVGAAHPHINLGDIKSYSIPVATFEKQRQIVGTLDSLSEETQGLKSLYQSKLAALNELKKSLLHRAFSGNL